MVIIGILGEIAISSQQALTIKAQVARAAGFGQHAADAVADYEYEHQRVPKDLKQAGFTEAMPAVVKKIDFDSQQGAVVVTMSKTPVEGKTLLIVPKGKSMWKCLSREITEEYLPPGCRQNNWRASIVTRLINFRCVPPNMAHERTGCSLYKEDAV